MPIAYPDETGNDMPTSPALKKSRGEDAVPAPTHSSEHVPQDYRTINGWGVDSDPANRPAFPKEFPSDVKTVRGEVKDWQRPRHRVHISNEHPNLTPVFGESVPSGGLSGKLRDYAFEYGEATNRHWMTLLLADRIDVLEHTVGDPFLGKGDNLLRERGWAANLAHPRETARRNYMLIGALAVGAILLGAAWSRTRDSDA